MKPIIQLKSISKVFGKGANAFKALKNINLEIYKGESIAIVGKSGSGKSTLMHILALLDQPTTGSVVIAGQDVTKLRASQINRLRNQSFGFVFQQFFMNANDTVLNNVLLPLKIAKVSFSERKQKAQLALKIVGLTDKLEAKAKNLSGGQKQRVCIARAIINQPKVIFADEPTGNLDSSTGNIITKLLFSLNRKGKVTLILVTHDEDLAKKCGRIIRIKDGQIVSDTQQKGDQL